MKLFRRRERKTKDTENGYVPHIQAELVHVTSLAVNAGFYKQQVGEGQIRILTLYPGSHLDPVYCTLREFDTTDAPKYDAISYCWTHDADLVPVTINGFNDFRIPAHLLACLRRIRQQENERHIWVDAICINQGDEVEKSEQVRQMPKIYGGCWQTLIWLGETEPDVPSCTVRDHGYCMTAGFSSIEHGSTLQLLGDFLQDAEKTSLRSDPKYLLRVWWKRLWCVQEFMLSPRVPKIMIGPHLVGWSDFVAVSGTVVNPIFKGDSDGLNGWQAQSRHRSLLELLRITSTDFACTDPRDRIFALLGITNDTSLSIQADYEKTTEEVYSEATMYLINVENSIDMLLDQRPSRLISSLPTWVPDFMNLKDATEAGTPDGFQASREKPVTGISFREPSMPCGCTGSCLTLRAIRLDTIVKRVALEVETPPRFREQICLPGTYHHYREASSGCNSDRLSGPKVLQSFEGPLPDGRRVRNVRPTRFHPHRQTPRMNMWLDQLDRNSSFLDWFLGTLAVDTTRTPVMKLDRLPQIGLLFLDYLFNGSNSLEKAVMYHRQRFAHGIKNRTRVQDLMQRHQLPNRQAVLHDLQIALEVFLDVLDKVSRSRTVANVLNKADKLIVHGDPSSRSHEYDDLSSFVASFNDGPGSLETVKLSEDQIETVALTVDVAEAGAEVQKSASGYERVFFKTNDQHLGVGPGDLQEGDEVVVPFGSSRPWVLRSHGDHHVLVGDAFVPGIMTGQLEELWKRGEVDYTDCVLR